MRVVLPNGLLKSPYGPGVCHVSHFRCITRTRHQKEQMTFDIFGPNSCDWSNTTALQSRLESRLTANLDINGSPECNLTWRHWDTRSAPRCCRLVASVHRIGGIASFGLRYRLIHTPITGDSGLYCASRRVEWRIATDLMCGQIARFYGTRPECLVGYLHPSLFGWLMGYPIGVDDCGATATP